MTEALVRERLLTADEFWDQYSGREGRFELVDGRVVAMPPVGHIHGEVDSNLAGILGPYVRRHKLGKVYINTGFTLSADPVRVRVPDEAFVSAGRIAGSPPPPRGYWQVAPDLAVEIVSPDDSAEDINDKVADYLEAGVRMVWVIYPRRRQAHVARPGEPIRVVGADGALEGEDVLPGFRLPLAELW